MPPQEAFHQFLASTGSHKVVPVKMKLQGLSPLCVDRFGDWQLQVAGHI